MSRLDLNRYRNGWPSYRPFRPANSPADPAGGCRNTRPRRHGYRSSPGSGRPNHRGIGQGSVPLRTAYLQNADCTVSKRTRFAQTLFANNAADLICGAWPLMHRCIEPRHGINADRIGWLFKSGQEFHCPFDAGERSRKRSRHHVATTPSCHSRTRKASATTGCGGRSRCASLWLCRASDGKDEVFAALDSSPCAPLCPKAILFDADRRYVSRRGTRPSCCERSQPTADCGPAVPHIRTGSQHAAAC